MRTVRVPKKSTRTAHSSRGVTAIYKPAQIVKTDTYLQRLAHISQLCLLALGVFGYFYTVRPVFQYQLLQEQTAKLEIEKTSAQQQLTLLQARQDRVKDNIRALQEKWEKEKDHSTRLANDMLHSKNREIEAKRRAAEAEVKLHQELKTLDTARWELVLLDFTTVYFVSRTQSSIRKFDLVGKGRELGNFILAAEKEWPTPYEELLSDIDAISKKTNRPEIPKSYYTDLRAYIKSKEPDLQCEKPNFRLLRNEYGAEITALEPSIDAELNRYIAELQNDYAKKNTKIMITDDFRSRTRRHIQVNKETEVEYRYREKLTAFMNKCDQKVFEVIKEMGRLKGVKEER